MPRPLRRLLSKKRHGHAFAAACTVLASLIVAALLAARPGHAAEVSRRGNPGPLTIAILDLADASDLAPVKAPESSRAAWRTSFGSERQNEPEVKPVTADTPFAALAESDAVLIQGVKAAAPLRRLFPPRTWRLIVSRSIISPGDPEATKTERIDLPAATAIAVKAKQTLRVTARAHALRLDDPAALDQSRTSEQTATATAVRLVDRGRTLWLASVALPASCTTDATAPCPARQELEAWREAKRGAGEATLVGGRLIGPAAADTGPKSACPSHRIESDLPPQALPAADSTRQPEPATGCISIVRIGG